MNSAARHKLMSTGTPHGKENIALTKSSSVSSLTGVGSKIPMANKFKTPVDRIKRPLKSMNTQ